MVPVCFVLIGDTLYHAIDAKPKRVTAAELARVRNVRTNPNAVLLVDHYEEDWRRLWYVLFRGRARLLGAGMEQRRALAALRRKYTQYRTTVPLGQQALVIAVDIGRLSVWQATPRAVGGARRGQRSESRQSPKRDRHSDRKS